MRGRAAPCCSTCPSCRRPCVTASGNARVVVSPEPPRWKRSGHAREHGRPSPGRRRGPPAGRHGPSPRTCWPSIITRPTGSPDASVARARRSHSGPPPGSARMSHSIPGWCGLEVVVDLLRAGSAVGSPPPARTVIGPDRPPPDRVDARVGALPCRTRRTRRAAGRPPRRRRGRRRASGRPGDSAARCQGPSLSDGPSTGLHLVDRRVAARRRSVRHERGPAMDRPAPLSRMADRSEPATWCNVQSIDDSG